MEMILEGSNSAETSPPWGGVARIHRPVTGKLATWLDNYVSSFFSSFFPPPCFVHIVLAILQYIFGLIIPPSFSPQLYFHQWYLWRLLYFIAFEHPHILHHHRPGLRMHL
ncbi:hypothetical protein BDV40DRAFT_279294 [Aspergillus tamarii]|uniref:Uncharacterized protein n=1 Tax=Aspergillus tamarii TaxID=41984 RepID=A0A5N6UEU9_ASPTM|nr:hypothetical protein BDV40DRAFT_279294 [Aspergillus tamarii]